MRTKSYADIEAWLAARIGKLTGSRIKSLRTKPKDGGKPIGYYEYLADLLRNPDYSEENPMARGHRLEPEAIEKFEKETGKKVDTSLVIWEREDDERIAVSPDGSIGDTEAAEVKCLDSKYHLQTWDCQKLPKDYDEQSIQYFVVNPTLQTLYFCFYDPRLIALDFFFLEIRREAVQDKVDEQLEFQKNMLREVDEFIGSKTF